MKDRMHAMIDEYYNTVGDPSTALGESVHEYHQRHGTESACILTVTTDERADDVMEFLRPRIEGKVVVEIGAGIGLLACHVAQYAKRVYAIEVDPAWSSCFVVALYAQKPPNLTFIFGKAEEAPPIVADVAYFCTLSGRGAMYAAASRFAPEIIDVYDEVQTLRKNRELHERLTATT